jgi:eukaryotic-like serine/threonine-protein kinase
LGDRYRPDRELGQGGMATVYLAHDLKHDREVALKVLRPELAAVLGAERFLREIRLTAQLQHPHILTLIDSDEATGTLYYVMPYVAGESLRQRLVREGQLPVEEVTRLAAAVASALDYAHSLGIIHRDIKPENILLHQGEPMVADFGIALAASQAGRERLTETGLSLGTPAYMSPEQASASSKLDGRSDQYSLACVVYEMLTGEPPYTGPSAQAIIAKRFNEPIPRLTTLRAVPMGVEAAVTRALARAPADRFPTVTEFAVALTRPARPARRVLSLRMAALLGGVAVMGVTALLAWLFRPAPSAKPMLTRQLTFTGGAGAPAVSPDGKWIAYWSGDTAVMVQELSGGQPLVAARTISGFAFEYPGWSPDGATLYFSGQPDSASPYALYSVPRLGGTPQEVAEVGREMIGLHTAGRVAVANAWFSDTLRIVDLSSGRTVRRFSVAPHSSTAWRVPFSPDGRWIAFGGLHRGVPFLGVVSSDGKTVRRLVDWVDRGAVRWDSAGDAIYFEQRVVGGADLMKVRIDRRSGDRLGNPVRVISHAQFREFDVGADGRTLAYERETPTRQIWTLTIDGPPGRTRVATRQLTTGTNQYGTPDISPDGRLVAFARDDEAERNFYVTPFAGGPPRLLAATRSDYFSPRWSPDSKRLAFAAADSSTPGLMIADLSGSRPRQFGESPIRMWLGTTAWSPDGKTLLYPPENARQYVVLDVEHNRESILSAPDSIGWLHAPVFSPDGRELVVMGAGDNFWSSLWRVALPERRWSRLGNSEPGIKRPLLWADDGWVYYASSRGIRRVRPDSGQTEAYATLPIACDQTQLSMARDARRLVCTVIESRPDIWIATDFDPEVR